MIDFYSTPDWAVLCAEVMKLRITRERGKVIALPLAKAVRDERPRDAGEDAAVATPANDPPRIAGAMGSGAGIRNRQV